MRGEGRETDRRGTGTGKGRGKSGGVGRGGDKR